MAEAIAVGAGLVALIQIADRIISLCKLYVDIARDAPSDLRAILLEISALKTIFENLNFLSERNDLCLTTVRSLCGADGPVKGCLRSMTELEALFPSDSVLSGQGQSKMRKLKSSLASLAWPLKESRARKLLDQIMLYKSTITLALTTDSIQDIKDTKARTSEIHDMLTESQRQELYKSLQHTDPSPIHLRARKDYEPGTGNWILRSPEWSRLLEGKDRCLWIHGIPGAGKTVLISYLIEQIQNDCNQSTQQKNTCVYYYCYFAHNQDETKPFLKWLVNKLCRTAKNIPIMVNEIYKQGKEPNLEDLLDMLAYILTKYGTVYVVLDAIDESNPREELLKVLQILMTDLRFKSLQVIASSRNYFDIEKTMKTFSVSISMDSPFVEEDIRCRVRSILQSRPQFRRWPRELVDEVEETVTTDARGMFRWAVCQIDVLQRLKCERHIIEKALKSLPRSLNETYDRIMNTIPEEERLFIYHVLRWIAHHNELYNGQGIPYKMLIQAAETSIFELTGGRNERFYDKDTLREICGCLINISPEDLPIDVLGKTHPYISVTLAHYTVREYLDSCHIFDTVSAYRPAKEENLKNLFMKITILAAQQVDVSELWEMHTNITFNSDFVEIVGSNFNNYCVVSALLSLYKCSGYICQHDILRALAIDFLDPSKPHFEKMNNAALLFEQAVQSFSTRDIFEETQFWFVDWYPETSLEAMHIYHLLLLTEFDRECVPLARAFLREKDCKDLLHTRLHFKREVWNTPSDEKLELHEFDGSLIEVFAQLALRSMSAFKLLMEFGAGFFDPSTALLFSIGGHKHSLKYDCKDFCPVERLIELGADPNTKVCKVTPLQIATVSWDLEGVSTLLKAGAHPNSIGSSGGKVWEEGTILSHFNHLHGASPLRINRHFEGTAGEYERSIGKKDCEDIEALLLLYGAKEI